MKTGSEARTKNPSPARGRTRPQKNAPPEKRKSSPGRKGVYVRMARIGDIGAIHSLLALYAGKQIILPRTPEDIRKNLRSFCVAEVNGGFSGCCALRDYRGRLFEIRSLAVEPKAVGKGIGSAMVEFLLGKLSGHGRTRVFALTASPGFFTRLGFRAAGKEMFPEKIWNDCAKCLKLKHCDEKAVMIEV